MNYQTNNNFVGILNLYAFSSESAAVMRPLFEKVMRDPDFSTIPVGHREFIAARASYHLDNSFMHNLHLAVAEVHLGEGEMLRLWKGEFNDTEPEKIRGLRILADELCMEGLFVGPEFINDHVKSYGASDREVHDAILIVSLSHMMASYMIPSDVHNPPGVDKKGYQALASYIINEGYDNGQTKNFNC
jgi:hypothetical protein